MKSFKKSFLIFISEHKVYLLVGLIILGGFVWYYYGDLFSNNQESLVVVKREQISRELFETGTVKRGDNINLSFLVAGVISDVKVEVGDSVKRGQVLAELDKRDLSIRITQAEAGLTAARAKLDNLLSGRRPTEIAIYETAVELAENNLLNSQNSLKDAQKSLIFTWRDAYSKTDDAIRNYTDRFFHSPRTIGARIDFHISNQNLRSAIGLKRIDVEQKLESWEERIKSHSDLAAEKLLSEIRLAIDDLEYIEDFLNLTASAVNDLSDDIYHSGQLSGAEIKSLTTSARNLVSGALSNLQSHNEAYRRAQGAVDLAENNLEKAQRELILAKEGPRDGEVRIIEAEILAIQSDIDLLRKQFNDASLRANQEGKIITVNKRTGENISPHESIIVLLPNKPFEIEVDIYEGEIALVEIGDEVEINLVAFPDQTLEGKISSIEPMGRIIDGVVYYRSTVQTLSDWPEGLRPGMTADLVIKVDEKDNSLVVPYRALYRENGLHKVKVKKNGQIEEKLVTIGIRDSAGRVEILSGLEEGQVIVLP
ncbi:MAG TPA: HlyD family efflux transporter periplasmic adaptor subunit [Candidatus Vogelbacteria bacterium]|nr:HlyD family efflux transporter periplasmic adaptor subunit [Candidatus Vogelbacteria bacterium]